MVKYLACGNIMSDRIKSQDGTLGKWNMGGPAFYALSGIRLWSPHCKLVCQTGLDYQDDYAIWMEKNNVPNDAVRIEMEHTTRYTLRYDRSDGGFTPQGEFTQEHLGYLKTHPNHIDEAATQAVKGIYICQNPDKVFWKQLAKVRDKHNFKIMWEMEYGSRALYDGNFLSRIQDVAPVASLWSINHNEASHLFGIPRKNDDDIINELMKLPFEMVFYRVGKRGSFVIIGSDAYFCPMIDVGKSIDSTGCGNCSTGAAMAAYLEENGPARVAVMANIAAGYNAMQYGPYQLYTPEVMRQAAQLAQQYDITTSKK